MRGPSGLLAFLAAMVSLAVVALACTGSALPDVPELEQQATSLNRTIMCPVCPGESIDQSQNPLAVQMRAIVFEKLTEGWSGQQIKDFFAERYGRVVLLDPPTEGIGLAAWVVPPVVILVAVVTLLLTLHWMSRSPDPASATVGEEAPLTVGEREEYFQRIEAALDLEQEPDNTG
jgi:cytochrome c-type biogenesis protein CcmH